MSSVGALDNTLQYYFHLTLPIYFDLFDEIAFADQVVAVAVAAAMIVAFELNFLLLIKATCGGQIKYNWNKMNKIH